MSSADKLPPRIIPGLSHRYGDALTVDQMLEREHAERERLEARLAPPPPPPRPRPLVTVGGKPLPPYQRPKPAAPATPPKPAAPPKPATPLPTSAPASGATDRAVSKLLTTTEQLTPEERQIVRGYRLSIGGPAADEVRRQIEREVRRP